MFRHTIFSRRRFIISCQRQAEYFFFFFADYADAFSDADAFDFSSMISPFFFTRLPFHLIFFTFR